MAMGLALGNVFAGIGAFGFAGCSGLCCTVIRWTLDAGGLLGFGLVEALAALDAHVHCAIEIGTRCTNWDRALFDR